MFNSHVSHYQRVSSFIRWLWTASIIDWWPATHQWKSDRIVIPWKLKRYHEAGKPQTLKWLASMCIEVVTLGAVFHGISHQVWTMPAGFGAEFSETGGLQLTPSATHLVIHPAWWHLSQILHRLLRGAAGTAREGALLWNVNAGHGGLPRDVLIKVETCFCFSAMSAGIFRFHPFASSLCMTLQCCSLKSWVGCKTPDWEVQLTVLEIITRYHDR